MFGTTGRRAVEIVVGVFALLGFVCVPLGQKTGWGHVQAIAATPAARDAAADLGRALLWARTRLFTLEGEPTPAPRGSAGPSPELPKLQR